MCGALVFRAAAQGMPFDHLTLVSMELVFLGPKRLWQLERWFLVSSHTKASLHRQGIVAKSSSFCEGGLITYLQGWYTYNGS